MSSSYINKALSNFAFVMQRFETIPVQWNGRKKEFRHTSDSKKLLIWKINCFISFVFGVGASAFVLAREILSPTNSLSKFFILIQIAFFTFGSLWIVMALCSLLYGDDYVNCWNESAKFLDKLRQKSATSRLIMTIDFQFVSNNVHTLIWICKLTTETSEEFDVIGLIVYLLSFVYNTYPIFLSAGALYFNLDPLYPIIKESLILNSYRYLYYLAKAFRYFVACTAILGASRQTFLSLIMLIIINRMHLSILCFLNTTTGDLRFKTMWNKILRYTEFQMFLKLLSKQENVSLALLAACIVTNSGGNYICILYYRDIPPMLYPGILAPLVISYFGMNMVVPIVIRIYDNSVTLLTNLSLDCPSRDSYASRKVKGLQPSYLHASVRSYRMFHFQNSTRVTFYRIVFDMTLNLLMGLPRDSAATLGF